MFWSFCKLVADKAPYFVAAPITANHKNTNFIGSLWHGYFDYIKIAMPGMMESMVRVGCCILVPDFYLMLYMAFDARKALLWINRSFSKSNRTELIDIISDGHAYHLAILVCFLVQFY